MSLEPLPFGAGTLPVMAAFRFLGKPMKLSPLRCLSLLVASLVPLSVSANDFTTSSRVEYVLQCMKSHNGQSYDTFYKCSCAVDEIAKQVSYNEFAELSTAFQYQRLGGERGAEFRDPALIKTMVKKYQEIEAKAADVCFLK